MSLLNGLSSLVCAGLLTATAPIVQSRDVLPAAKAGFTLEVKGNALPSLLDLLNEYQRVTGMHLVLSQEVLGLVSRSQAGMTQTLVVPQDKVHTVVESFLAEAGFCTVLLHAEEPVLLAVKQSEMSVLGANAFNVAAANLGMVEKHAALICSTMIDVDSLNPDELYTMLKGWNEKDFRAVNMVRSQNRVMLTGKGKEVASRARSLQELNESARAKLEEAKKTSGGSLK